MNEIKMNQQIMGCRLYLPGFAMILQWCLIPFLKRVFGLPSYRLELIGRHTPFAGENTSVVFRENGN